VPVGIRLRVAQLSGDPVFQSLRDEMLQPIRLVVNLVPGVIEEIVQETFQQAVVTKHLKSALLSRRGQTRAVMLFVLHKWRLLGGELLEHPCN
jgi:hypothetical protein